MTDTQFLAILGTVWLAPHCGHYYSILAGSSIILIAVGKGLGWI
jgi:hypothetical protein